jgi:hypothetical protein
VARDHDPRLELEPGEEVIATAQASFRGAAATSVRATFALGSARVRDKAYRAWLEPIAAAGFPTVPADMILALTNRRLLAGHPRFWAWRRTSGYTDEIGLDEIAEVAWVRHGMVTGAAFALRSGTIVEVEAMRSRRLRILIDELEHRLTH